VNQGENTQVVSETAAKNAAGRAATFEDLPCAGFASENWHLMAKFLVLPNHPGRLE
jgi:hypothetical protein